jgi:hypothetical protein
MAATGNAPAAIFPKAALVTAGAMKDNISKISNRQE